MKIEDMAAVPKTETTNQTREKSSAVGSAAAMREALEQIHGLLSIVGGSDIAMCLRYEAAYLIAAEALSEPPRNRDVGTAEEQSGRCGLETAGRVFGPVLRR